MPRRTVLAMPRMSADQTDRDAVDICTGVHDTEQERRARHRLLALALASEPYAERVENAVRGLDRICAGDPADRSYAVSEHFTTRLHRVLVGTDRRPPTFLMSRAGTGSSFSGWVRHFLTSATPNVIFDVSRAERSRPDLLDPVELMEMNLAGAPPVTDPRWEDAEEEWRRRAPSLRGRSKTLLSARILERALSLRSLRRVEMTQNEREQVLVQSQDLRTVAEAVRRSATGDSSPLSRMLQRHSPEEIDDLLSQSPMVVARLVEAAATPSPPLRRKVVDRMVSVLLTVEPSHPRILRSVVVAWAELASDLTCSEYRAGAVATLKDADRVAADRVAFETAFGRAHAAGLRVLGDTAAQCADQLLDLSNVVEATVDADVA